MTEIRLITLPEVLERVGVKKTKLYAMIKENKFPQPVKLNTASRWPDRKVTEWIENQLV